MNVLVIGLGSMGKRRIRLIKQYDETIGIIGIDTNEERRREAVSSFGINVCEGIEEALNLYSVNAAFVSTSPLSHGAIIKKCLDKGLNVFTEINLTDEMYDENINKAKEKGLTLFLSSTFLYREEIKYITERVKQCGGKVNYCYHVGQYLPDWHPWESYKSFFVGDKRTNGCRELMAIELPWIINAFGSARIASVKADKLTDLEIDYADNFLISLEHSSGAKGLIAVDVVSRKAVRNLEVFGKELYISWDGSPTGLYDYDIISKEDKNISLYEKIDKEEGYQATIIENAYLNEIKAFIMQINENKRPIYSFEDDKYVLGLIDEIEGLALKK